MDRISTSTKATDLFGVGKHGYRDGNLGGGVLPTDFNAEACNGIQEEMMAIVEGSGQVGSAATRNQVFKGLKRLYGGNVRVISAAGPTVLTVDDAGLVLIDATANAVAITLPAVNSITGAPLLFEFVRIDSVLANAVTVSRAGADTFAGGATSFALSTQNDFRSVMGDSTSKWVTTAQASTGGQQAGEVALFARKSAPTGFLKANGAAISRSTYAVLFAALCASGVVTTTIASPCTVAWAGNTMEPGERFRLTTTGALPTGLTATTQDYYVSPAAMSVGASFTFSSKQRTEFICSMSIATPGVVTTLDNQGNAVAHGLVANEVIVFDSTGALPTGAVAGTPYFVSATGLTTNTFQFSTILGGGSVATSGTQSGTHLLSAYGAQINTSGAQSGVHTATAYPFGAGDGTTTFNIPELRGEFLRALDDGRLVNPRRVLGSTQSDEIKSHNHYSGLKTYTNQFTDQGGGASLTGSAIYTSSVGGIETRPRNMALLACIKF
jgi:microcystin-dependent protein